MILGKKINNDLYVKRIKIERRHEVVLLEITLGEECNFKKHIENICHVAKYNRLPYSVQQCVLLEMLYSA